MCSLIVLKGVIHFNTAQVERLFAVSTTNNSIRVGCRILALGAGSRALIRETGGKTVAIGERKVERNAIAYQYTARNTRM